MSELKDGEVVIRHFSERGAVEARFFEPEQIPRKETVVGYVVTYEDGPVFVPVPEMPPPFGTKGE